MPRKLQALLLGSIAIAFLYLIVHAREPLRLNVGDPWSDANVLSSIKYVKEYGFLETSFTDILDVGPLTEDSYRYIHYPPFSEIIYGAIGKYLGVSDIGTYRLFALGFSTLAMWLLFSYVRRMYSDRVALIATMLFSTSLFWMMYADSMHQAPVMQCTGFLALWGLVRAIETRQRRHYAAAIFGSFACFFTSYDYMLFLPAAVLFTVYVKLGNPFARGNRNFVALCAAGCFLGIVAKCLTVIGAVGWHEFVADVRLQFFERATSTYDRHFKSGAIPTLVRRITISFTPLAWIAAAYHVLKAVRAPSVTSALKDTAVWMLLPALAFLYVFSQLAASQMLASQVLLPFYSIGSALLIERMLEGRALLRRLAYAWLVIAPLWSFFFVFRHTRSVLDRDDVAKTNAYLAQHDRNDFVISNLMSDGHIQASFDRHYWAALDSEPAIAQLQMLRIFELTGTDYVHEIIFTDPDSRFIDKSLWPLALPRRRWSATGWPFLYRAKTRQIIAEYDAFVMDNLEALRATKVLDLSNFDVYRVDRRTVLEILAEKVPVVRRIDFGSLASRRHVLLGWTHPHVPEGVDVPVTSIAGFGRCPMQQTDPRANACKTVLTKYGLKMKHEEIIPAAQLLLRLERSCDLQLKVTLPLFAELQISMNGFTARPPVGLTATVTVPAHAVRPGVNVVELMNTFPFMFATWLHVSSLDITPLCGP